MTKRVIFIVLLFLLALFVYVGYHSYDSKRVDKERDRHANDAARRADQQGENPSEGETIVYPNPNTPAVGTVTITPRYQGQKTPDSTSGEQGSTGAAPPDTPGLVTQTQQSATGAPATDTISPNPPNGMLFGGSGRYQLYRQGNITWRLDTETGRTCIIFATYEEWRKPRVYRSGCGKT